MLVSTDIVIGLKNNLFHDTLKYIQNGIAQFT